MSQLRRFAGLEEQDLRDLLALMAGSDLLELEVTIGKSHLTLRRPLGAAGQPGSTAGTGPGADDRAASREAEPSLVAITSPLVGVFRPSVGVGSVVAQGQPIGSIEAMGMPTSVDAPHGGTVEELLAHEGLPVEYGQALLVLRREEGARRP